MLPPIDTQKKQTDKIVEMEDMTKLFEALQKNEAKPNIITLAEFAKFEPLFRRDNTLSGDQIVELSKAYFRTFDPYREIKIVTSHADQTVRVTLPALFTPYRAMDNTKQNSAIAAANQKLFHSNVPRYSAEAFGRMILALRESQLSNAPVIEESTLRYREVVDKFYQQFPNATPKDRITETDETTRTTEWDAC